MSWREDLAAAVKVKARRRLVRELCRALETGLERRDVEELLVVALRETCREHEWRLVGDLRRRCARCDLVEVVAL